MNVPVGVGFVEIADRVWVSRYDWFDQNIAVVGGSRGLAVIDTRASAPAARECISDLRRSLNAEVVALINTHEHFDHVLGNATFRDTWPQAELIAHEHAARRTVPATEEIWEAYHQSPDERGADEVLATKPLTAESTFSMARVLDLGDRVIELVHPGRGHTGGDIVAWVPDVKVLAAGDLVEESPERGNAPGFGPESHPLEWPSTLEFVLSMVTPEVCVIPGHGALVDREYVERQADDISIIAETIKGLAEQGIPLNEALAAGQWPYPSHLLKAAVTSGYRDLPASSRRLPLV